MRFSAAQAETVLTGGGLTPWAKACAQTASAAANPATRLSRIRALGRLLDEAALEILGDGDQHLALFLSDRHADLRAEALRQIDRRCLGQLAHTGAQREEG